MKGRKTGGRLLGTPNKTNQQVRELIGEKYPTYHPLICLIEIATDPANDTNIRLQANKEVAKYLCPQLKSIEVNNVEKEETKIIVVRTASK